MYFGPLADFCTYLVSNTLFLALTVSAPPPTQPLPDQATGNFPTVTRVLLSKIPPVDGRMTYVYDEYVFHYVVENGIW